MRGFSTDYMHGGCSLPSLYRQEPIIYWTNELVSTHCAQFLIGGAFCGNSDLATELV